MNEGHEQPDQTRSGLTALLANVLHRGTVVPGTVVWQGAQIVELAVGRHVRPARSSVYEFPDGLLVPGLIDLHTHGGGGAAVHTGPAALAAAGRWHAANGTTAFLASVPALGWAELLAASHSVAETVAAGTVPNLLGLHLEGPFLNPARAGSLLRGDLRQPSLGDYLALRAAAGSSLRVLTIAPELPGAADVIAACRRDGVVAALGHSDATFAEASAGFAAGIGHVTHLYNAMRPFHHREPGAVGAALVSTPATLELIVDGQHVAEGAWRLALAAAGAARVAYISDSLPAAGDGHSQGAWLGRPVVRSGRRLLLADGTLAGSDVALREAVQQAVRWGQPPAEAIACATAVPAGVLGLGQHKGQLLPGYDADLAVFGPEWQNYLTVCGGRRLWPPAPPAPMGRRSHATP